MPKGLIELFTGAKTIYIVRNLNLTRDIFIHFKINRDESTTFSIAFSFESFLRL